MASISIGIQTIHEKNSVNEILNKICDSLDKKDRSLLMPWLPQIEEYAIQLIDNLRPKDIRRRKGDVLVAAALYDAFLEFESRTKKPIRLPFLQEALSLKIGSINAVWKSLFDNKAPLTMELIEYIRLTRDQTIEDAISVIINQLTRATQKRNEDAIEWLRTIERDAIVQNGMICNTAYSGYDIIVIAATLVYAAAKFHHSKMRIRLTQRELAILSGVSTSLISKCWVDLFGL
ncbi:hypothetical protein EU527_10775 [Candidatus Thorarchaeota archaeon]|nr:MAG: hypothetical protein EU527_10775 [Candidatus Thorarchaeota archaeon]